MIHPMKPVKPRASKAAKRQAALGVVTKVLRLRIKDKHAAHLLAQSREVNQVWNYSQDLALQVLRRENRFMSAFDSGAKLNARNHPHLLKPLPGQSEHRSVELRLGQRHGGRADCVGAGPHEAACIESARCAPHTKSIVHQQLDASGPGVGKQVPMMGLRGTKHQHDVGKQAIGACSHVYGQPQQVHADHRSSSRIQAAHSLVAALGQVMAMVVAPRRSSIRMSAPSWCVERAGELTETGTNSPTLIGRAAAPSRSSRRQRCTTLALMPCDSATLATDTPGAAHCLSTQALSCAL
jgi:hypothetical protein